jgi:hypothetical protein
MFGVSAPSMTVGDLWRTLAERLIPGQNEAWSALQVIFDEGPLARRLLAALGDDPDRDRLAAVYRELCDCLQEGVLFRA